MIFLRFGFLNIQIITMIIIAKRDMNFSNNQIPSCVWETPYNSISGLVVKVF